MDKGIMMTKREELCFELALNEYLSHWNGNVDDTLEKLNKWRSGRSLSDEIIVWKPFENYFASDLIGFIHNSAFAYSEFADKIKEGKDEG